MSKNDERIAKHNELLDGMTPKQRKDYYKKFGLEVEDDDPKEEITMEDFENDVNDKKTTMKIAKAFNKADEQIRRDIKATQNIDVVMNVVRKIRKARTLEDAKKVLLDSCVDLYNTETIASIIQYSMIEGPSFINPDDDPKFDESFAEFAKGEIGKGKDEFDNLTEDQIYERFSKRIIIHDGISEEVYTERNGRWYTLDKDGNKVYKDEAFINRFKSESQLKKEAEDKKINRRKDTVKKLLTEMDKLTPEIEAKISSCTTIEEIEQIYALIKSTVPQTAKSMVYSAHYFNEVAGNEPMTDAEVVESNEDAKEIGRRVKELDKLGKIRPEVPMTSEEYKEKKTSVRKRYRTIFPNESKPENK